MFSFIILKQSLGFVYHMCTTALGRVALYRTLYCKTNKSVLYRAMAVVATSLVSPH